MSTDSTPTQCDHIDWEQRYQDRDLPWDTGRVDMHLPRVLKDHGVAAGRALEIGCGTGSNGLWLASQGFEVLGTDLSPSAIAEAQRKLAEAPGSCRFRAANFLVDAIDEGPFDLVYDRACFHVFDQLADRQRFVARVAELLAPEGLWHSLLGSTDGPPRDSGPPRRCAAEIIAAVEPHLELLELRATQFDDDTHAQARAWVLVARRRPAA